MNTLRRRRALSLGLLPVGLVPLTLAGCAAGGAAPPAQAAPAARPHLPGPRRPCRCAEPCSPPASAGRHVSFVDPAAGVLAEVEVAPPLGGALGAGQRVYVATAEGVAVVDTARRERVALVPYRAAVGPTRFGEYRPGGMGIAARPPADLLYVGVYLGSAPAGWRWWTRPSGGGGGRPDRPAALRGPRPAGPSDRREAYALDHDSYSVTVVDASDPAQPRARTLPVAPLGRGAFDKLHYGAVRPADGRLLLPVQGRVLLELDPAPGSQGAPHARRHPPARRRPLSRRGDALRRRHRPRGGPRRGPASRDRPGDHDRDPHPAGPPARAPGPLPGRAPGLPGRRVSFADGGWDGLTVVDLAAGTIAEMPVPARPLDVLVLSATPDPRSGRPSTAAAPVAASRPSPTPPATGP